MSTYTIQELYNRCNELYYYSEGQLISKRYNKPVGRDNGPQTGAHLVVSFSINSQRKTFLVHRLIFLMMSGTLPEIVDHINNDPLDNRWENLRAASKPQNTWNSKKRRNNSSGFKGVRRSKSNTWIAEITCMGKRFRIGCYPTPELAHEAYKAAAVLHFGEFARFD